MTTFRTHTLICLATLSLLIKAPTQAADPLESLRPFLKKHCIECHGPKKQENDFRIDTLDADFTRVETLEAWQDILDQTNAGDMPPEKSPRPTSEEAEPVRVKLTTLLREAYAQRRSTGASTVIRRLNRHELRNTLRDLLYLKGAAFRPGGVSKLVDNNGNGKVERTGNDPVRLFPEDEQEQGFVNIGNRLVMSDFLLKLTIGAAQETLALATHTEKKPSVETRRFAGHLVSGKQYGQQTLETVSRELNPDFDMMVMRFQRFGRLSPHGVRQGVGSSARYRITVEVSGHNQTHPWGEVIQTDQTKPFVLGLNIANTSNGGIAGPTSTQLVQWSFPGDGKKHTFSFESWLDSSWTPWIGWENGPYDRQFKAETLVEKYLSQAYTPRPDRKKVAKEVYDAWPIDMARALLKSGYKGPHIRVYSMTLEPLIDTWPPKSHTALYGVESDEELDVEELLVNFAARAYRQPVARAEVAPFVKLVERLSGGTKTLSAKGGIENLSYKTYQGEWSRLPDFSTLKPTEQGVLADGLFDLRATKFQEHFGLVFEGKLNVSKAGEHHFEIASDDGSRLLIDGKKVVEHDGLHGASTKKGSIQLAAGKHTIRVEYFAFGKPNSLRASWSGPGFGNTPLSAGASDPKQLVSVSADSARLIKALQAGYTAILCSPRFLYIQERGTNLTDYEIASRLSYFLWSSMPDERLMQLAKEQKLTDHQVRSQEVQRMLKDPKAAAFTRNFTVAWLRLDKLGKMPPEKGGPFRFYHDRKIEPMMISQTAAYFSDIVATNGNISKFIDSDYTYMNEILAIWMYGRKDVFGEHLRKVKLNDARRGGIFTQPSVMTATANGVDTSPVVRGIYVLENILGTPPPPPPPGVDPIPPDLRGATTIREQLAVHREQAVCNGCHRKIDPLGFAMENFDAVGRWREKYPRAKDAIDASSVMANGTKVEDIVAFKQMLSSREADVTRCLTEKLLTYASGRILESTDRGEVDRIVAELEKKGNGMRDLIMLVVESNLFLTK